MKIEVKQAIIAERYFYDRLPLPAGVDKIASESQAKCRDCNELLAHHGWLSRVKKVCPGNWVINGLHVMTPKEFAETYKARQDEVQVKGESPWN